MKHVAAGIAGVGLAWATLALTGATIPMPWPEAVEIGIALSSLGAVLLWLTWRSKESCPNPRARWATFMQDALVASSIQTIFVCLVGLGATVKWGSDYPTTPMLQSSSRGELLFMSIVVAMVFWQALTVVSFIAFCRLSAVTRLDDCRHG